MELILASVVGALSLASAMAIKRTFTHTASPGILEAVEVKAGNLKRVLWRPARKAERPRVVVQGPKVKPIVCQICIGRIKEGLEYAKCGCGKTFHITCLARTAFCPYCNETFKDGVPEENIVRPAPSTELNGRKKPEVRMLWEPAIRKSCPVCGREMDENGGECVCGAIIIDDDEVFECPSCGTEVPANMMQCPGCRERFDLVEEPICPICGLLVSSQDGVCDCGGLAKDECPQCGASLAPEDTKCPSCGTIFELV